MESKSGQIVVFVTGGHFTPAKAVVDKLGKYNVFYVGRKYALEGDTALSLEYQEMSKRTDITFLEITTGRMQRRFTKNTIPSLLKIPVGFFQSFKWILKYHPKAVMSFGGYVSIPVSTVAVLFGIPVVNHEQIPAFDYPSKYLNAISKKVLVSFPHLVKTKEIYTGNPVREEIFEDNFKLKFSKSKTLYVTGGNQGSHIINEAVLGCLDNLLEKYNVIWQTGDSQQYKDFDKVPQKPNLLAQKFFSSTEIGSVFKKADLVVSRSGANTVTELAALGKPSILIPIPWVHDAEQQKNAETLTAFGGSKIIPEADLTSQSLNSEIDSMMENISSYKKKSEVAKKLFISDAAGEIVKQLESVIK